MIITQINLDPVLSVISESGILGSLLLLSIGIIGYQYRINREDKKKLSDKVQEVMENHIQSEKDNSKDRARFLEKFHDLANEFRVIFMNTK